VRGHVADIADVILAIEAELRRLNLWEDESPPRSALLSLQPFCYDTLRFNQWLQWVFLPRMRVILEDDLELPEASDIHPLAEEAFRQVDRDSARLLALIKHFDQIIAEAARQRGVR